MTTPATLRTSPATAGGRSGPRRLSPKLRAYLMAYAEGRDTAAMIVTLNADETSLAFELLDVIAAARVNGGRR